MISRALNALGLMKRSEHEATAEANDRQAERIRSLEAEVRRITAGRDDWKSSSQLWKARFENSESDRKAIDKQADQIIDLKAEIQSLRHDAQKWRDKLSRDRAARKGSVS